MERESPFDVRLRPGEPIGTEAVLARIDHLATLHDGVVAEMEANQREYEALRDREHQIMTEHSSLLRKL